MKSKTVPKPLVQIAFSATFSKFKINIILSFEGPGNAEYYRTPQTTERQFQETLEEQYMESFQKIENNPEENKAQIQGQINLYDLSNPYQKPSQGFEVYQQQHIVEKPEEAQSQEERYVNNFKVTTEQLPSTNVRFPESEIYYTTPNYGEPSLNTITIQEVYNPELNKQEDTTLATTTSSTSTTTEPTTTTKVTRSKIRQNKYDVNRPRFSVKDYKQRLNQYASTTTSTDKPSPATHSPRVRLPNRFRKPIAPVVTAAENEETTEVARNRFVPKDSRHRYNQEQNDETTTEKQAKIYSTRIRSFGRYRSTTETPTTTAKISIKPNLFANRRRPPSVSLKTRIQNKQKQVNNTEEYTTTKMPFDATTMLDYDKENEVPLETTPSYIFENAIETTTEFISHKIATDTEVAESTEKVENEEEAPDILSRNESFMYSQRVSDLTSSAKYDQPGHFKAVSPNSRRVPSYFTIATDDPILPIEAFFPNLKDPKE